MNGIQWSNRSWNEIKKRKNVNWLSSCASDERVCIYPMTNASSKRADLSRNRSFPGMVEFWWWSGSFHDYYAERRVQISSLDTSMTNRGGNSCMETKTNLGCNFLGGGTTRITAIETWALRRYIWGMVDSSLSLFLSLSDGNSVFQLSATIVNALEILRVWFHFAASSFIESIIC